MRMPALKRLKLPRVGMGWIGAGALAAASFWAGHSFDRWTGTAPQSGALAAPQGVTPTIRAAAQKPHRSLQQRIAALQPGTVYVRRDKSVLRAAPKSSAKVLKHEAKGAGVTLLEKTGDGWAKVQDGPVTGWMRASVLGAKP